MKAAILYNKFFDHDGREQLIGGVETYLLNLARLCQEMGMETIIYQWSNLPFEKDVDGLKVRGIPVCCLPYKKRNPALFRVVVGEIDTGKDILIFGSYNVSVPTKNPRYISIQHGISWDLPAQYLTNRKIVKYEWAAKIKKRRSIQSNKRNFENCQNTVCVDYNFLNWYRTIVTKEPEGQRVWVIPNFTQIAMKEQIDDRIRRKGPVRILYARRFEQYRGTRIMAQATRRILEKNNNIMLTFAGEGPDEQWLRTCFVGEDRIKITRYLPDEAMKIHLEHDIAVIPSIASEGTSLSVAEAMGAGCAIVATAVGGITNMIISGYNGLLIMPDADCLFEGIAQLIDNSHLRRQLGKKAYETAMVAFGSDRWKENWRDVLNELARA